MKESPRIFLDYPPRTKGYKIYDAQHNTIIISRDVKFVEDVFFFSNVNGVEKEEELLVFLKEREI